LERGQRARVHRDQISLAEERVQLVELELADVWVGAREPLGDQEQVIAVFLELRSLVELGAVFDGERMEPEASTQDFERTGVGIGEVYPPPISRLGRADGAFLDRAHA